MTDSGGVQKEAFFLGKRCITVRDETEWTELVACDANCLVGPDPAAIHRAFAWAMQPLDTCASSMGLGTLASASLVFWSESLLPEMLY